MFVALIIVNIILAVIVKLFLKLTCGICPSNKHMVGKVVIITGANVGIGFEAAKDLAARGAKVILACRDQTKGENARDTIIAETENEDVHYRHLDHASFKSVRKFADDIIKTEPRLDVLINNAGAAFLGNKRSEDGLLLGMQVNHFGPFLLTNLLLPLLKSSAPSRIVNVSSMLHTRGVVEFGNLNMEKRDENSIGDVEVYSNSKLFNILMTVELDRQLKGTGVTANSLHPGAVFTEIMRSSSGLLYFIYINILIRCFFKSAWEGCQTTVYLAVAPELKHVSGRYFVDCKEKNTSYLARDKDLARKLWIESERIVKLK